MNSHVLPHLSRNASVTKLLLTVLAAASCLSACSVWSQTTATVTANPTSVSAPVAPEGYGLNTYAFDAYMTSGGTVGHLVRSRKHPMAEGGCNRFRAIGHMKLLHDVVDVMSNCVVTDIEGTRDLLVRRTLCE